MGTANTLTWRAAESQRWAASGALVPVLVEASDNRCVRNCSSGGGGANGGTMLASTSGMMFSCAPPQACSPHHYSRMRCPSFRQSTSHCGASTCLQLVHASSRSLRYRFPSCCRRCGSPSSDSYHPSPSFTSHPPAAHILKCGFGLTAGAGRGGGTLRCRSSNGSDTNNNSDGDGLNGDSPVPSPQRRAEDDLMELPLFPLPLVLFPDAVLPLQIFEYRYRIMMHTLLETELRFGIIYSGKDSGNAAAIGCVGEIVKHERLADDRFFLICRGLQRFRVVDIVRTKPYLVGKVTWLEDVPSNQPEEDLDTLAADVETLMKDVIRLSNKISGKPEKEVPEDLRKKAFPTPFSFWVASTFEGAPVEQQSLLEVEDTAERLRRERDTLRNTLNYLTAATAVKDVFSSSSPSGEQ